MQIQILPTQVEDNVNVNVNYQHSEDITLINKCNVDINNSIH